jgi:cob(I)alamin adenosyltransferase
MGELATCPEHLDRFRADGFGLTSAQMVDRLTAVIDNLETDKQLYGKGWATPGATPLSAALDVARTVCRRAERRVAALGSAGKNCNGEILRYLNRLSDLCWLLGRYVEKKARAAETHS